MVDWWSEARGGGKSSEEVRGLVFSRGAEFVSLGSLGLLERIRKRSWVWQQSEPRQTTWSPGWAAWESAPGQLGKMSKCGEKMSEGNADNRWCARGRGGEYWGGTRLSWTRSQVTAESIQWFSYQHSRAVGKVAQIYSMTFTIHCIFQYDENYVSTWKKD